MDMAIYWVYKTLKSAVSWQWLYKLSWLFFACWLWCNNYLVRSKSYCVSLTFKCQSTIVVLFKPPGAAGRVLWNRVCLSFYPAISLGVFLGHCISLYFGLVLWTFMKFCMTEQEFLGEKKGNRPKIGFFKLEEKFGH